jgi:O-antigen ligase
MSSPPFRNRVEPSVSSVGVDDVSYGAALTPWNALWLERNIGGLALVLTVCAIPLSIALSECLLGVALVYGIRSVVRHDPPLFIPRVLWFWLPWAGLEVLSWLHSPEKRVGLGEMRHLLLPIAVFIAMRTHYRTSDRVAAWRGLLITGTVGSASVICSFFYRLLHYRHELAISSDPSFYLRTGGLLNHWMVYATVEIMVFAGLLEFWHFYPEARRGLAPMMVVNGLAIVLSLTRALWICSFLLLALYLFRRRSRWIWATPFLPFLLLVLAPVRARISVSLQPDYYSNAERLQMLRVGWEMLKQHVVTGVGPGRVEALYRSYLLASDPVPAYHGHLHNNAVQLAAQFGLPVLLAATGFVVAVFLALIRRLNSTSDREVQFLCSASLLALTGFLLVGLFDYTYGHALGILLASFVVMAPF